MLDWVVFHGMAHNYSQAVDLCSMMSQIILSDQALSEQVLGLLTRIRAESPGLPFDLVLKKANRQRTKAQKGASSSMSNASQPSDDAEDDFALPEV